MIHAVDGPLLGPVEGQVIISAFRAGADVQIPFHGIVSAQVCGKADAAVAAEFVHFFGQFLRVGDYLGEGFLQRAAQREVLVKLRGHPVCFLIADRATGRKHKRNTRFVKEVHLPACGAAVEEHELDRSLRAQFFGQRRGFGIGVRKPQTLTIGVASVVQDLDLAVGHHEFFDDILRGAFRQQGHVIHLAVGAVEAALDFFALGGEFVEFVAWVVGGQEEDGGHGCGWLSNKKSALRANVIKGKSNKG